jgi:hypothetical protein
MLLGEVCRRSAGRVIVRSFRHGRSDEFLEARIIPERIVVKIRAAQIRFALSTSLSTDAIF